MERNSRGFHRDQYWVLSYLMYFYFIKHCDLYHNADDKTLSYADFDINKVIQMFSLVILSGK